MFKEFKDFVMRGNVLDLAVAVIMGGAFGAIINSLVNDMIMPPIGVLLGNVDFSALFINLSGKPIENLAAAKAAGLATINYGIFLNTVINFLIVAGAVFFVVRTANRLQSKVAKPPMSAAPAVPTTKECPYCLSTIPIKATRCAHCTSQLEL